MSPPLATGQGNKGGQAVQQGKKTFKACLLELFEDLDDDDDSAPPAGTINSVSTTGIAIPQPAEMEATAQIDEVQAGPSRPNKKQTRWAKSKQYQVDFLNGL